MLKQKICTDAHYNKLIWKTLIRPILQDCGNRH